MISNLFGNPHSASTPATLSGHRVDAVRERALRFLNADPEEWELVFTANATASIKLVIECFRDYAATSNTPVWYGYHRDSHTSVVGVRELTKMHRCFTSDEEVDIWINSGGLGGPRARQLGLFAYPGQSNMTGRRLPLSWFVQRLKYIGVNILTIHRPGRIRKTFHKAATYTLLDAAALASTAPLDLADTATAPDFVALSFYKIFGFPDVGALLVQKKAKHVLEHRRFFGGGTVDMVISVNDTWHAKKEGPINDRLEDGTLQFHSIIALDHAITVHERLYGPNPMKYISHHTAQLGKQMYDGLSNLRHSNGRPVARIYKDESAVYGDPSVQGSTVAFNVQNADGRMVGYQEVEEAANAKNIYVRAGSLCNPGGVATYLNWSATEMKAAFAAGHRCSHPTQVMLGKPTGVVRVSMGAMSTAADVQGFLNFLREEYIDCDSRSLIAETVSLSQRSALRATMNNNSSIPTTPSSPHATTLDIPHALYVPKSPKPSYPRSAPPSIAPSTTSDGNYTWESERTALPSTNPPASSHASSPRIGFTSAQISENYFPGKLARQGQNHSGRDKNGMPGLTTVEVKLGNFRDFERAKPGDSGPLRSGNVKSRSFGRSVASLLHRKGHIPSGNYSHPDIG